MTNWKIIAGDMVVEQKGDHVSWNEQASNFFHDKGKYIFDSVRFSPVVNYVTKGWNDGMAVYLNSILYFPQPVLTGEPPVILDGDCIRNPEPPQNTRKDSPEQPVAGPAPQSGHILSLKDIAEGTDGLDPEIRMLFIATSDEAVAQEAKDVGSADPGAAKLRAYWTHGPGAAKIGWGAPHDFDRCVLHLSKYVGSRAKGLCNVYHRSALGVAPGQEG